MPAIGILAFVSGRVIMYQISRFENGPMLRHESLDIIKGFLVFLMITYHVVTMAESTSPELMMIKYPIVFIHFAFLVMTGFLCAWYYQPKIAYDQGAVKKRLRVRSLKIILILLFSNLILYACGFDRILELYVISARNIVLFCKDILLFLHYGKLVAFDILLPIGVFLFFSSFLLAQKHMMLIAVLFTITTIFLGKLGIDMFKSIAFGGIGLIAGLLAQTTGTKKTWALYKKNAISCWLIFLGCLCSILIIEHFSLLLPYHFLIAALTFFWCAGFMAVINLVDSKILSGFFALYGRYTLLGYMSQMLFIRLIYMLLNRIGINGLYYYIANVFISSILLVIFLKIVTHIRINSPNVNVIYRFLFQ